MRNADVIVVGAGPAGLLAAGSAAQAGAKVLVLEKMYAPGRKLLITGKGRCNVTNEATISEFITHIFPDGRFLRSAFASFFSHDIISLLAEQGVNCTLERGGRYFPESNQSKDILNALLKWVNATGVEIICDQRIEKLVVENDIVCGVKSSGEVFSAANVILATGGKSYPPAMVMS
jgi:predicted Rossmann fold flavoprotein